MDVLIEAGKLALMVGPIGGLAWLLNRRDRRQARLLRAVAGAIGSRELAGRVDVAAGTVVRVQVVDEEARPEGGVSSPEGVPNTATVQRAREIAAQAEWPAWEFGL